jgi:protein-disulfide isomerase
MTGAVALAVFAVATWHVVAAQVPVPADKTAEYLRLYAALPRVTVPVSNGGAAVLIVKFTDYQCPACALTHRLYGPIFEKYEAQFPGAVKLVIKDFPLNTDCNPSLAQTIHSAACDAAVAVALARTQKHGPELEDWLYSNQQLLTPATVRKAADVVGGVQDFTAGYAQALQQVKADASLGRLLDVNSTPTFFINGAKIGAALQPEMFDAVIAYELRKAGKMK